MIWTAYATARRARASATSAISSLSVSGSDFTGTNGTDGTSVATCASDAKSDETGLDPIVIEAMADAFHERLAVCTADGISEAEARRTAEAEIGSELVKWYVPPLESER